MNHRLLLVSLLVACDGEDPPGDSVPPGADSGVAHTGGETGTGETGGDTDTGTDPGEPGVAGILVDPDGAPVPYASILCCTITVCYNGETRADGRFEFAIASGTPVALKTHPDPYAVPRWAAALEPAVIGDVRHDAGEVYIPDLPPGAPVADLDPPQTLAVGDGLELTVVRADLRTELGTFLYDLAARELPPERIPPYDLDEPVLTAYALHPFATESSSPVGISVEVPGQVQDGDVVHFRSVSHLDGTLSEPAIGRALGGRATTDPGQGIRLLTHLVVSIPPN